MPNQRDPFYTHLGFKIDHENNVLMLKQCNLDQDPHLRNTIRIYRIKLNRIISAYIEGPFGCTDDQNVLYDDMWRFVVTVSYPNIDHILCERDIVLYVHSKEHAEDYLDILNKMIGM